MQSEAGKLLYSKTALKRCTSTEHLCKRKLVSLTSPEHCEIFLPRSERSWRADVLYTPKVSIAVGSNKLLLLLQSRFYIHLVIRPLVGLRKIDTDFRKMRSNLKGGTRRHEKTNRFWR